MNNQDTPKSIQSSIMEAIEKGKVRMRPRWHFILLSILGALGTLIVFLTLLYTVSLGVFFLHDTGVWFTPIFGPRGWFALLRSVPFLLLIFLVVFVVLLEFSVRRYAFVYRKPLITSVIGILVLIALGGFAIAQTSFNRQMELFARHNQLPAPLSALYGPPLRIRQPDVYHGTIVQLLQNGFIMVDSNGDGTSTITFTHRTRLPDGEDFSPGMSVVVIGDVNASGTVQAFGVRAVEE